MNALLRLALAVLLTAGVVGLMGCQSGGSTDQAPTPQSASLTLNGTLTSHLQQIAGSSAPAGAKRLFTPDQVITGQLLAHHVESGSDQIFQWSAYLDETTLAVESNKTIVLFPGTYDFSLLLEEGAQQFAGEALGVGIVDGENTVAMTIRPIIGDTVTNVEVVARLADFKFQYDPLELGAFSNPVLGIILDGGLEQLYEVNPATGLSYDYLNLSAGSHTVQLRFYDGGLQKGRSISAQESVTIVPGANLVMDLVALQGETVLALSEAGGDATFSFSIPEEVVNEAGGTGNLQVLFAMAGLENPLQEALLTLTGPTAGTYAAEVTLSDMQYGAVDLALSFTEQPSGESLGICNVAGVELTVDPSTVVCPLTLRRRAIVSGHLLATLGINVFDPGYVPIAGASVYAEGELLGLTGSGAFGTEGYLKAWLVAGSYLIEAVAGGQFGDATVNLAPLSVDNVEVILDGIVDADGDSFSPPADCDDTNPAMYPGAPGTGAGIDNNCDGVVDGDELAATASVVIDFEGLLDDEAVGEFYNGGTGGSGSGPGPDLGVSFSPNLAALTEGGGGFGGEPSPVTIAILSSEDPLVVNVQGGFSTGVSLFYVSLVEAVLTVHDGPDGTGNVLASLILAPAPDVYNWVPNGVTFGGTALSVVIASTGGPMSGNFGLDDLTLGSAGPGGEPGPTTLLDFEGLQLDEPVGDYYAGGLGGLGSGPGPDLGVTFSPEALAYVDTVGSFITPSPPTVLYYSGSGVVFDVPGGFTTGISLHYVAAAPGEITVYDGPGGTGTVLATATMPTNALSGPPLQLLPFGLPFAGTAYSVRLSGAALNILYDDIVLGSAGGGGGPPATPFDAWAMGSWDMNGSHYPMAAVAGKMIAPGPMFVVLDAYVIFDLAAATGTVTGASLQLPVAAYYSTDPDEQLVIVDVTTDAGTLSAGAEPNLAIFSDLMAGATFGTFTVTASDVNGTVTVPLSPDAVAAINLALGGPFSVGMWVYSLSGAIAQEAVAFGGYTPPTLLLSFE